MSPNIKRYVPIAIVLVVIVSFLGLRTGAIVGLHVPLTMIVTLCVMYYMEIALHRISLATLIERAFGLAELEELGDEEILVRGGPLGQLADADAKLAGLIVGDLVAVDLDGGLILEVLDRVALGPQALGEPANLEEQVELLAGNWKDYDFFFLHYKYTDSAGEDGNFAARVERIEQLEARLRSLPLSSTSP